MTWNGAASDAADDPERSAAAAQLRYVSAHAPGIRRLRRGRGFAYVSPDGDAIREITVLARIRSIVIPPAWTDVWICADARGHLQATGRDARGRKQYRYHARWRAVRDETKYGRLLPFGDALPRIRAQAEADLQRHGLPKEKVVAAVVLLLGHTRARVGNAAYARDNRSYGLTTLRDRHADVQGSKIRLRFRGKSGKVHALAVNDRRLANIVRRCRDLPGQELFQYVTDDGSHAAISSDDVNDYLRTASGQDFTAKDFRTWAGTVLAAVALSRCGPADSSAAAARNVVHAITCVAEQLGNTPAVCRKCYIHPAIVTGYLEDGLPGFPRHGGDDDVVRFERALLRYLRRQSSCLEAARPA